MIIAQIYSDEAICPHGKNLTKREILDTDYRLPITAFYYALPVRVDCFVDNEFCYNQLFFPLLAMTVVI
jgi:hypothetical protein